MVLLSKKIDKIFLHIGKRESALCFLRALSICFAQVCFYSALARIEFEQSLGSNVSEICHTISNINAQDIFNYSQNLFLYI